MATLTPLCQLKGGCMGCCGHDFESKGKIKLAIQKNTAEYEQIAHDEQSLVEFRNRAHPSDLRSGVCRNLINEKGGLLCPLHPTRHEGKDLREGHCDINYLCTTAKTFANWDKEKQVNFLAFIEKQNIDNIEYSIKMDKGEILKEFEKKIQGNL